MALKAGFGANMTDATADEAVATQYWIPFNE